jgi:uncharacterized protein (TIGR02453 family)
VADDRPVGGSLFRIYRDVRFSKDKSPYKTHVGISFRHRNGKDVHAPGYYLHLEPGQVFAAAGIWHPDREHKRTMRVSRVPSWARERPRCPADIVATWRSCECSQAMSWSPKKSRYSANS